MGTPMYRRLERQLSTRACGCKGDEVKCPQHLQAMSRPERMAYLAARRRGARGTQRGRGTA